MPLVFAAITPHPPIIIPGVGSRDDLNKAQATITGMTKLASLWAKAKPETTIVISPHAPLENNYFAINDNPKIKTNLAEFGAIKLDSDLAADTEFINHLKNNPDLKNLLAIYQNKLLDHGTSVPLYYFLQKNNNFRIISLSFSLLSLSRHLTYGKILGDEISKSKKRFAVIASGDLSHALSPQAPAGFSPQGKIFDEYLIRSIKNNNLSDLANTDERLMTAAAECGLRSFVILAGILKNLKYKSNIISYEAPWGVGYLVVNFHI